MLQKQRKSYRRRDKKALSCLVVGIVLMSAVPWMVAALGDENFSKTNSNLKVGIMPAESASSVTISNEYLTMTVYPDGNFKGTNAAGEWIFYPRDTSDLTIKVGSNEYSVVHGSLDNYRTKDTYINPSNDKEAITEWDIETTEHSSKVKYGFWPYWIDSQSYQPDWSGLTHVSYFSMDANSDGTLDTCHIGADYYNVRDIAHSHNVKVTLTVTTHDHNKQDYDHILAYHRNDLANNISQKLQYYGADGVSIDFEGVSSTNSYTGESNKELMEQFMQTLHDTLKNANPNYHLSFCVMGSVETVYRNADLSQYIDAVFLMGYDYHWSSAPTTGALSPYDDPNQLDVVDSVNSLKNYYLPNKIILGLPFYGYDWPCSSNQPGASTTGNGTAVRMKDAIANAQTYGRIWDSNSHTPWYRYQSGDTWHQCWYDDDESLGLKFDYVNDANLGGTGFWALGYEGNNANIWNVVKEKFGSSEGIYVEQHIKLEGDHVAFTVKIRNNENSDQDVSVRYLWDTQLCDNDGSPLKAKGTLYTKEMCFEPVDFDHWSAYSRPEESEAKLVTYGWWANIPDKMIFAHWPEAIDTVYSYDWNPNRQFYTPGYVSSPKSDSCVLMYWENINVPANGEKSVTSFYGTSVQAGLTLSMRLDKTEYRPNEMMKIYVKLIDADGNSNFPLTKDNTKVKIDENDVKIEDIIPQPNKEYLVKVKAPSEVGEHTVWMQVVTDQGSAIDSKDFSVSGEKFTGTVAVDLNGNVDAATETWEYNTKYNAPVFRRGTDNPTFILTLDGQLPAGYKSLFEVYSPGEDKRISKAIEWGKNKLGSHDYDGLCYSFVRVAYESGADSPLTKSFGSAKEAAEGLAPLRTGLPPRGAYVFYEYGTDGHVGLSLGNSKIIHACAGKGVIISDDYDNIGGCTYIGWAWPPVNPPIGYIGTESSSFWDSDSNSLKGTWKWTDKNGNPLNKAQIPVGIYRVNGSLVNVDDQSDKHYIGSAEFYVIFDFDKNNQSFVTWSREPSYLNIRLPILNYYVHCNHSLHIYDHPEIWKNAIKAADGAITTGEAVENISELARRIDGKMIYHHAMKNETRDFEDDEYDNDFDGEIDRADDIGLPENWNYNYEPFNSEYGYACVGLDIGYAYNASASGIYIFNKPIYQLISLHKQWIDGEGGRHFFARDADKIAWYLDAVDMLKEDFDPEHRIPDPEGPTASETHQHSLGVCDDYAMITIAYLRATGIPSRFATGWATPFPAPYSGHAWVRWANVTGDEKWHNLDTDSVCNHSKWEAEKYNSKYYPLILVRNSEDINDVINIAERYGNPSMRSLETSENLTCSYEIIGVPLFKPGEETSITVEITNPTAESKNINVTAFLISSYSLPLTGATKQVAIPANSEITETLNLTLPGDTPAGDYNIEIYEEENLALTKATKVVVEFIVTTKMPDDIVYNEPFIFSTMIKNNATKAIHNLSVELDTHYYFNTTELLEKEIPVLDAGENHTFTWTFTPIWYGNLQIDIGVYTSDAGSETKKVSVPVLQTPKLSITPTVPEKVKKGDDFFLNATVFNSGDLPSDAVNLSITTPPNVTAADNKTSEILGTIGAHENKTCTFKISQNESEDFAILLNATSTNATTENYAFVNIIQPNMFVDILNLKEGETPGTEQHTEVVETLADEPCNLTIYIKNTGDEDLSNVQILTNVGVTENVSD
ncbi:MAG: hypothetical protein DRO36_05650, partial [Candidatus Hecatellales archaeon]